MFPVSVTQQSPAAVSMETYHITLTLPPTQVEGSVGNGVGQGGSSVASAFSVWFLSGMVLRREGPWEVGVVRGVDQSTQSLCPCPQLEVNLEEIPDEGLLVSWAFSDRPDLSLTVLPKLQAREVREQGLGWGKRQNREGKTELGAPPLWFSSSLCTEK